jgi:hypothetical protein
MRVKVVSDVVWQSFVFKLLQDYRVLHGVFVWSLIPREWRYWWLSYMVEEDEGLSGVILIVGLMK